MKGIIFAGIQQFIEQEYGDSVWQQIKSKVGCTAPSFLIGHDYPDQLAAELMVAAGECASQTLTDVMVACGRFLINQTIPQAYPAIFRTIGSNPREFLLEINRIHDVITRNVPNATPPRFKYEEMPNGLGIHYFSKRKMCALMRGLVLGVGDYFNQSLTLNETACIHHGDHHCIIEVRF